MKKCEHKGKKKAQEKGDKVTGWSVNLEEAFPLWKVPHLKKIRWQNRLSGTFLSHQLSCKSNKGQQFLYFWKMNEARNEATLSG